MPYNEHENRIIEFAAEDPVDINKIQECFDMGADPNALDECSEDDQDFLFTDCFTLFDAPDLYPLLECFLKNGLDVNRFAERIISDIIYLGDNDRFRMIKLIFDSLTEKVPMSKALESVRSESSFYNCNPEFYKGKQTPEWEANDLEGIYVMIEAYEKGENYDGFRKLPEEINQKLISVRVSGEWISADEDKLIYRYKDKTLFMIIEMERDILLINNGYAVYINNKHTLEEMKNDFTNYAEHAMSGTIVERISFHPYSIDISDQYPDDIRNRFPDGRTVTVEFSGGKKIVFTTDIDTGNDTVYLQA